MCLLFAPRSRISMEGLLTPPTSSSTTIPFASTNASADPFDENSSSPIEDVASHLHLITLLLSTLVSITTSLLPFLLCSLCSDKRILRLGVLVRLFFLIFSSDLKKANQAFSIGVVGSQSLSGISSISSFPFDSTLTILTLYALYFLQHMRCSSEDNEDNVKETEERIPRNTSPPSSLTLGPQASINFAQSTSEKLISLSSDIQGSFKRVDENNCIQQTLATSA